MLLAQELAQEEAGGGWLPLLMIVGLFAIFYFLLIRPQQTRKRQALQMQAELTVGDQVVTVGGLHGTIVELDDDTVILETSEGVFSRYERAAVGRRVEEPSTEEPSTETEAGPGSDPIQHRDKD